MERRDALCKWETKSALSEHAAAPRTCSSTFCIEKSPVTLTMLLSDSCGGCCEVLAVPVSLGAAASVPSSLPASLLLSDIHSSPSEPAKFV